MRRLTPAALRGADEEEGESSSAQGVESGNGGLGSCDLVPSLRPAARRVLAIACICATSVVLCVWVALNQSLRVETLDETISPSRQCVVRVNTFRRNDLLAKFVEQYAQCSAVAEITVVWSDVERRPPSWLAKADKVHVERHSVDSLNNRFTPLEPPPREAVLSIDDDIFVTCETVQSMVDAWRSAPRQMVGLAPRLVTAGRDGPEFKYLRWWHVYWNGAYSLVLSKIAVFHRDYLAAYTTEPGLAHIRQHVHDNRNCEDLALSFLVANATNAPPLWLKAAYVDYGQSIYGANGISAQQDHVAIRENCLALFTRLFGTFPLVTGRHKISLASKAWLW